MSLSKPAIAYLALLLLLPFLQNCGSGQNGQSNGGSPEAESNREFPFSTKEPDEFQADFVRTTAKHSEHSFFARKGSRWRYDTFDEDTPLITIVQNEKRLELLHKPAVYAEYPEVDSDAEIPDFVSDLTLRLLDKRRFASFEDLGSDGGIRRYRAIIDESESSEVLIDIDEKSGLIINQEFLVRTDKQPSAPFFRVQLKNLKLAVDDKMFEIPKGYKKVAWSEFERIKRQIIK